MSAYINAARQAAARTGDLVLVIDAGDMWQGTIESNLNEGAAVVEAYNAIGVTAAAIGNHEFDFGPVGEKAIPVDSDDDARGALKQRFRESNFPVLAANLIVDSTGQPVEWDNVSPSVVVDAGGVSIGIIGVMSEHALTATIAANTVGLTVAPLLDTITHEARALRETGVDLVIVSAHAGGFCSEFMDPEDLSSCRTDAEIMRVASGLEPGLVDHIFAGHTHQSIAHTINGISITSALAKTLAFSRVDFQLDGESLEILDRRVHPPQSLAPDTLTEYEGVALVPMPEVERIAAAAAAAAQALKQKPLGVTLSGPFDLTPDIESAIGNLVTEATLDSFDADIAIHNVFGGLRSGLPAGELTYGAVYEMFPFDNTISILELSGEDLRHVIARQAPIHRKAGFAGMRVFVSCTDDGMNVVMRLNDGREIQDDDRIRVIANDFLAPGGDDILTPAIPEGGFELQSGMPLVRDALVKWFMDRPGTFDPADFRSNDAPKWNVPETFPQTCQYR